MHTLIETVGRLTAAAAAMPLAERHALETACEIIEAEAKRVLGTYDYGWPPLQPETVARKRNGDTPLLETGEMRDSIEHKVAGHVGYVGSNNMKAVWQELGTSRGIPPRSFLMGAAMRKEREVVEKTGHTMFAALAAGFGGSLPYAHWSGKAITSVGKRP